jgi:hypothetical protein
MPTYSYPENVTKALKENGLTKKVLWDCHGTFVIKHSALETIAANKGITFDEPVIVESNADKSIAIVMVKGYLGDKFEWTFGEATPKNSKNSYPYAMAEKRAKDRIILKLIGLHGDVYSEDEADDFKDEIKVQERNAKKVEKENVDTSVWGKIGKKAGLEAKNELTNYYAISVAQDKAKAKDALSEAKKIFEWAKKHNLVIIQDQYLKLFDNKLKSA